MTVKSFTTPFVIWEVRDIVDIGILADDHNFYLAGTESYMILVTRLHGLIYQCSGTPC